MDDCAAYAPAPATVAIASRLASLQGYAGCHDGYITDLARAWLDTLDRDFADGRGGYYFASESATDLIVRPRAAADDREDERSHDHEPAATQCRAPAGPLRRRAASRPSAGTSSQTAAGSGTGAATTCSDKEFVP